MSKNNIMLPKCIVCATSLDVNNTKVTKNQKYIRYRNLVCNKCFDVYYPKIGIDER